MRIAIRNDSQVALKMVSSQFELYILIEHDGTPVDTMTQREIKSPMS